MKISQSLRLLYKFHTPAVVNVRHALMQHVQSTFSRAFIAIKYAFTFITTSDDSERVLCTIEYPLRI